jgi:hypothetical protein
MRCFMDNIYPVLTTEYFMKHDGGDRALEYYSVWCRVTAKGFQTTGIDILIEDELTAAGAEWLVKRRNENRA